MKFVDLFRLIFAYMVRDGFRQNCRFDISLVHYHQTGHENNIAEPKTDMCLSSPSHFFNRFSSVSCCLSIVL